MQVVKNMLTSNPNKGPYMKPFFVLLLPVVLLFCGPASVPAQEALPKAQADAVAAIKKLGGSVRSDAKSGEVISVLLRGEQITDVVLEHLKGMTSLKLLRLEYTQITDAGLENLKGLTSLTGLSV
ncbi:MAG: hypothetical protein ABGZ35_03525, partial [Planctomycetaceae bacterium]